jgi:hypothetical protein
MQGVIPERARRDEWTDSHARRRETSEEDGTVVRKNAISEQRPQRCVLEITAGDKKRRLERE